MRKILFRGFNPDKNGKTEITLNGEKIKGEWVYGYYAEIGEEPFKRTVVCKKTFTPNKMFSEYVKASDFYLTDVEVLPETVGQWVATDKKGKDMFERDKFLDLNGIEHTVEFENFIYWKTEGVYMSEDIEVIGNIWEV